MAAEKLEQKLKVIDLEEMPKEVRDIFIAEYFSVAYLRGKIPAADLREIFRGNQIELLVRGPVDSGHAQWKASPWYEEQGITQEDAFVLKVDMDYLVHYLKENFNWVAQ